MSTPNPASQALYTRLQEVLGNEHAKTLMTYHPVEAGSDLATKADLVALEGRIDERFDRVDERFEKIDERFEKIDERFEKIDERLFSFHEALDTQYKNFSLTMVGAMSALTAIYAGLLAIIALIG